MALIYRLLEKVFIPNFSKLNKLMIDSSRSFVRVKTILLRTNNFLKSGASFELMMLENNNLGMINIKKNIYIYRTVIIRS